MYNGRELFACVCWLCGKFGIKYYVAAQTVHDALNDPSPIYIYQLMNRFKQEIYP